MQNAKPTGSRRFRLPRLLAAAALAAMVGATVLAVPAQAAKPAASPAVHAVGPITKTTAYGTMTYGFTPLGAAPHIIRPDSASGCNQYTCITIIGSSNFVSEWYTQGIAENAMCTWADFFGNAQLLLSADVVCGDGPGVFYWYWYPNRSFASPTVACNRWFNIPGYPCEVITR